MLAVLLHLGAHPGNDLRHVLVNGTVPQSGAMQHGAQDAYVSIAVNGYALNTCFNSQDVAYGGAEGKIVDSVPAVQQRAVNIEQISIGRCPSGIRDARTLFLRRILEPGLARSIGFNCRAARVLSGPAFACPVQEAFRFVQDAFRHRAAGVHPASTQQSFG